MKKFYLFFFWTACTSVWAQPNIIRIEYFIDSDPGRGSGTSIITASPNINILENVSTTSLSLGFHVITVRAEDQNGAWGLPESKPFFVGLSSTSLQNKIVAMEYFIDADPGRGSGVDIPLTPTINLNILENIPTSLLTEGFHIVTIRAQDQFGVWGLSESKPFFVTQSTTSAQNNITAMEYFIDSDPGRGSGVSIPITPAMSLDILENVPTSSLAEGFHIITVRAQDQNGIWGLSETRPFAVLPTEAINLVAMEYFIDTDPGMGLGTSISLTPGPSLNIVDNIPTSSLSEGFHVFAVRAQDDRGVWGHVENKPFYVNQSSTIVQNNIVAMEYFIDTDPGRGSGVAIPFAPAASLDILENIPTLLLTEGFHLMTVRAQDENGNWGLSESKPFYVNLSSVAVQNNITALEYYFDADPGHGNGIPITVTPGVALNIIENIPTASLDAGTHRLVIRARDTNNEWGLTESKVFFVGEGRPIINFEYTIDTDPGIALATQQAVIPPQFAIDEPLLIDTNPLSVGGHNLILRVQDSHLFWSKTNIVPFNLCLGGIPNFSTASVCLGSTTIFTDLSTGVLPGDTYSWDFDGDLIEDDNIAGSTSFTYSTAGSFTATLTIDRSGCSGSFSIPVDVDNPATASAGANQIICEGNVANLAGSIGGSATSITWSTAGTGTFDDPTSLTAVYTPGTTDAGIGPIAITLTTDDPAGTCDAAVSSLYITVNQQPTADAGSNQTICESDVFNLNGSIGGSASSSTWTTSGNGTFDDPSQLNATYLPGTSDITTGSVDLILTTDDPDGSGSCVAAVSQVTITIDRKATVDVGPDLVICANDNALLTATIGAFANNPVWSSSGTGSFSDPVSLTSSYNPSATDVAAGLVVLTLTADAAGICPQATDQLTLSISPLVIAGSPSIQSNIGQVTNVDVVTSSTINSGDVVVVTITQEPTKGSTSLLSDNSIDYISNEGTVGSDSFQFQICNQCNICSTGTVSIEVVNEPPVITAPVGKFTSAAGQGITIPFLNFLSDLNDNIDLNSIKIISGPISMASASFDSNYNLVLDYSNTSFTGTDELTVEVCDLLNLCTQITIQIEVEGEIIVYTGISPNGDGVNDYFKIGNIEFIEPKNTVSIFTRWGDKVFEIENYNNSTVRFEGLSISGKPLTSGVYFYRVEFGSGRSELTGYLTIKR